MATKYCDHGSYANSASFTASLSAATLTVTAISSGKITIGANILAAGITYPITINSYGTGTGGTGTYTVANHQYNGTVSSQAMTAENGGPAVGVAVPVWGVPQEGDGTSTTPATASAVVSIDMTGWVFSTASVVSVMGANVTCTASATSTAESATPNAQYSATLTTMIDNLVKAINLHGGIAANVPAGWVAHKVRDQVFARRTGNSLELMTFSGSASWEGLVAASFASVTNATSRTWAGGSGGCWGWLFNTGVIWPSATAQVGYGLWCPKLPLAGVVSPDDVVVCRSGKTIQMGVTVVTDNEFAMAAMGTKEAPVTFIIDDSTVWADGPEPVLKLVNHPYGSGTAGFKTSTASYAAIQAERYSPTRYGLSIQAYRPSVNEVAIRVVVPGLTSYQGVEFIALGRGYVQFYQFVAGQVSRASTFGTFRQCRAVNIDQNGQFLGIVNVDARVDWIDVDFDCGAPSAAHAGVLSKNLSANLRRHLNFYSCKFSNFLTGSNLYVAGTPQYFQGSTDRFRNCDFGGITVLGPNNIATSAPVLLDATTAALANIATSQLAKRDFFMDTPLGWCAWVSTRDFPLLNAKLANGIDGWSLQVIPSTVAGNIGRLCPLESPRIVKINTLSAAPRTLTVEVCIEQTLAWTKRDISLLVEYEDAAGKMQTIDTYDYDGGALTPSNALWNGLDAAPTFSNAGTLYFNRYKWSITAPSAIAEGTEIGCVVRVHTTVANANQMLFIDPEIVVA